MIKIFSILLLLIFVLGFGGCTSQSELKSQALKNAKTQYREGLLKEMEGQLAPSSATGNNFLTYVENHTDYEVADIKMEGETIAIVRVQVESMARKNRATLIKIAGNLDPVKTPNFNMGNANNLIEQQPGQVKGREVSFLILKFHKSGERWVFEAPAP